MYCPACPSGSLLHMRDNTKVVDFICSRCGAEFQLKARGGPLGSRLRDAAYRPMISRIMDNRSPNFAFLQYLPDSWRVRNLILVPGYFITPSVIERCRPLSRSARRAGWVGCNILMDAIPPDGRIRVIGSGRIEPKALVRRNWRRFAWLGEKQAEFRGWTADVLRCVRLLGDGEFSLQQVYEFEDELGALHPDNRNIRAKIRQQLQILRDRRIIKFIGRGRYMPVRRIVPAV